MIRTGVSCPSGPATMECVAVFLDPALQKVIKASLRLRDENEIGGAGLEIEWNRAFKGDDSRRCPVIGARASCADDPVAIDSECRL